MARIIGSLELSGRTDQLPAGASSPPPNPVDEGEARIRAAYPGATWDRLVAVKRRYDPDNSSAGTRTSRRRPGDGPRRNAMVISLDRD